MSDYCMLFSQTLYGLLFSYLTITDVTSYVDHKFPVSFVLCIATKNVGSISAALSSLVYVPPREESSREERGLLSRTAAGNRAFQKRNQIDQIIFYDNCRNSRALIG